MIKVENVTFAYPDGTAALVDVSLEVPREHTFAILGPSGSGKTTLLNCLARFLAPRRGRILLDGKDIAELEREEFRSKVGVVFQDLNLFPHMTVLENLSLAPVKVQRRDPKEVAGAAAEMLDRLGIDELGASYPSQVSGGQAQRAAIARGLMLRPEFLLLDEPTSALDARTTDEFADWLRELKADTTFVAVTHDLRFVRRAVRRGIALCDGRVACTGSMAEIVASVEDAGGADG
jgi:ABC-type polar amino acid transport system ATPase subunit